MAVWLLEQISDIIPGVCLYNTLYTTALRSNKMAQISAANVCPSIGLHWTALLCSFRCPPCQTHRLWAFQIVFSFLKWHVCRNFNQNDENDYLAVSFLRTENEVQTSSTLFCLFFSPPAVFFECVTLNGSLIGQQWKKKSNRKHF